MKKKVNAAKSVQKNNQQISRNVHNNQPKAAPRVSSSQQNSVSPKPTAKPVRNNAATANNTKKIIKKQSKKKLSRKAVQLKKPVNPTQNTNRNRPVQNNIQKQIPTKPVSEQNRRAADNAARAKAASTAKKRPYRGGNYSLYFILVAIVVVIVLVVLSNTVLFKCGTIEVVGTARYTSEEIIGASGLKTGENLLHIDTKSAEQKIISSFAFIDKTEVKKSFPTKIVIEITEAENWYAINQNGKKIVISRGERVLGEIPSDGLVVVKGFEAENVEPGCYLKSTVDAKNGMPEKIFETAEKVGISDLTEVDLTDRFSIKITVDNRIVLNIGTITQLESKLRVAEALIRKEIGEEENVSVLLTNPEKVAVESITPTHKPVQSTNKDKPEQSVKPESSSSEQPVQTT